jgi:SAM-dependent methyltransferase
VTPPFKDLFSRDSAAYAEFRPRYPAELFQWLASLTHRRDLVWDAGTGNGQAAVALAEQFQRVVATDPSERQLAEATMHPRVEYRRAGEESGLAAGAVDLVTVAQALHWFDRPRFWVDVKRILRPGGVLAVWCYQLQRVSPAIDRVIGEFYHETIGPYWPSNRKLVDAGYRDIGFPFEEITAPTFSMTAEWSLAHELGYLGTWSAVAKAREATGRDPVAELGPALERVWPPHEIHRVEWPVSLRVGRTASTEQ